MLPDKVTAETVLEAIYLEAWRTAADLADATEKPLLRLFIIARRRAVEQLRLQRTNVVPPSLGLCANSGGAPTTRLFIFNQTHEAVSAANHWPEKEQKRVRSAFAALTPVEQNIVGLAYFHGFERQEIARLVECSPEAVERELLSGLRKLRAEFERY